MPYIYTSVFTPLLPSLNSGATYPLVLAKPTEPHTVKSLVDPKLLGKGVAKPKLPLWDVVTHPTKYCDCMKIYNM